MSNSLLSHDDYSSTLYFAGIGGIGISALALIFKNLGFKIIGSDAVETPAVIKLRKNDINVLVPQKYENVSKYQKNILFAVKTNALPDDHIELKALKAYNIPILSYPQALGILTNIFPSIGIVGTHGKTTTTALISKILLTANYDILGLIGAFYKDFNNLNFRLPKILSIQNKKFVHDVILEFSRILRNTDYKNKDFYTKDIIKKVLNNVKLSTNLDESTLPYFVFEADEYKDAFLNHTFEYLVITSIDYDHADFFKTKKDYFLSFAKAIVNTKSVVIANLKDKNLKKVLQLAKELKEKDIKTKNNKFPEIVDSSNYISDAKAYPLYFKTQFLIEDLSFAIAFANNLKIDKNTIKSAIKDYTGVWRRFEIIKNTKPYIINDYAHNPKKLLYAGLALIDFIRQSKLKCGVIFFEPHQHNRLYSFKKEFLQTIEKLLSSKEICGIFITEIYGARSTKQDKMRISTKKFIKYLKDNLNSSCCSKVFYVGDVNNALNLINNVKVHNSITLNNSVYLKPDVVLIASAGRLGASI